MEVRLKLEAEIKSGFLRFVHFGLPCGGWAQANRLNGGTRRRHCPDGGPQPLERELKSNRQAEYVIQLCILLHIHGGWFTIENPSMSDFWHSSFYMKLCERVPTFLVKADLCAYGLQLPGAQKCVL